MGIAVGFKKMLSQVVSLAVFVCVCFSLVLELPFLFRVEGHSACVCEYA